MTAIISSATFVPQAHTSLTFKVAIFLEKIQYESVP